LFLKISSKVELATFWKYDNYYFLIMSLFIKLISLADSGNLATIYFVPIREFVAKKTYTFALIDIKYFFGVVANFFLNAAIK